MISGGDLLKSDSLSNLAVVRANGAVIKAIRLLNPSGAAAYAQLFDASATTGISLGTTVPDWVVQADTGDPSVGDGLPSDGMRFANGVVAAVTTTIAGSTTVAGHLRLVVF